MLELGIISNRWKLASRDALNNGDIVLLIKWKIPSNCLNRSGIRLRRRLDLSLRNSCTHTSQQIHPNAQTSLAKPGTFPSNSSGAAHRIVHAGPVMVMKSPDADTSAFNGSIVDALVVVRPWNLVAATA